MRIVVISLYTGFFGLFFICFLAGFDQAGAEKLPVRERLISIDMQSQDFTQALEAIANQAGIAINIHGQIPEGKRDLSMDQILLEQAMAQVMRIYGVRNHASAYNPETKTFTLTLLGSHTIASKGLRDEQGSALLMHGNDQTSNNLKSGNDKMDTDEDMLPNVDAYAEEYHREMKAKEQPEDYPEGLSQEEIDAIGRELVESVGN